MTKWISGGSISLKEVHGSVAEDHAATKGNPTFGVRLEVATSDKQAAITQLLGNPEQWPHSTILENVVAVTCKVSNDRGATTTDSDGQLLFYSYKHFLDLTYMPRPGIYLVDYAGLDVYWHDEITSRTESIPTNPDTLIWGNTDTSVPTDKLRTLTASEAPQKYENGCTLIHTIEGWPYDLNQINPADFIGTCNDADYSSPVLTDRVFPAGTLLLKEVQLSKEIVFRSYRDPEAGPPPLPYVEYSGKVAPVVKCIYEYRWQGWNKFWRNDANSSQYTPDYYYIRYAKDPYDLYEPFPLISHDEWLAYTP